MQVISYLLPVIFIAVVHYYIFEDNKNIMNLIKCLVVYGVVINVIALNIVKYVFNKPNILSSEIYSYPLFCLKYIILCLFIGIITLVILGVLNSKISFLRLQSKTTKQDMILKTVLYVLICIGFIFLFMSQWFISFVGEITPEQFLFNLKSPLKGTASGMVQEIMQGPVFQIMSVLIISNIILNFNYEVFYQKNHEKIKVISKKLYQNMMIILSVCIFIGGVLYGSKKLQLTEIIKTYMTDSSFIEEHYADPNKTKILFPSKKRNLIHIYLESVENSYLSKDLGGYMDTNLMPELYELSKEGISFSDNEVQGGPYQTYGSSWSVASMINMGVGIPLKIPMDGNSYGKSGSFLPGAIAIGDILETQGYNQTVMFGADADYGGLTTFYKTHGDFNIFDYKAAKEKKLIPEDYFQWWGFEDDKLYDYAKNEITRLYNEGKPFNFTMETADTHFPDGYLSPNVENKYDSQYANVIAYSTKETVDFVKWIQQQPFYPDTTIVITGDHLSMDTNFFKDFDPNYRRSIFNVIINSPIQTTHTKNRAFAPFDMFPTILASLNIQIEGDRLGLGTNLFSDKKTYIEEYGFEEVQEELQSNSNFFNDEFISEKKDSIYIPYKG